MKSRTSEIILSLIATAPRRPVDLVRHLGISQVAVHLQLKKLLSEGLILRSGRPPRVFYHPAPAEESRASQEGLHIKTTGSFARCSFKRGKRVAEILVLLKPDKSLSSLQLPQTWENGRLLSDIEREEIKEECERRFGNCSEDPWMLAK